jgi:hypothetical protein
VCVVCGCPRQAQVVFIIISDIGIDKMEAHLVSIKDSLDRDLMLVGVTQSSERVHPPSPLLGTTVHPMQPHT